MYEIILKMVDSKWAWCVIGFSFVFSLFVILLIRDKGDLDGKDLRPGLYGVVQVFNGKSPYENPENPSRTNYRYLPPLALLQAPFLLKSKMVAPYRFETDTPSILAWYFAEFTALIVIGILALKIVPGASSVTSGRNLKLAFVLAMPLILYEVCNGQNKIVALCFLMIALFFFERGRLFWSGFFFNWAIVIYIPLIFFIIYFLIRSRLRYLFPFGLASVLVLIVLPSFAWGFQHNLFLLKEWFLNCIKPFTLTNTYETYADLRRTSQSLPSVLGRLFTSGDRHNPVYHISPILLNGVIKSLSLLMVLVSTFVILRKRSPEYRGLEYSILLVLALLLPQYTLYYAWAYLFILYFAVFNFASFSKVSNWQKAALLITVFFLLLATCLSASTFFQWLAVLFMATVGFWAVLVWICLRHTQRSLL